MIKCTIDFTLMECTPCGSTTMTTLLLIDCQRDFHPGGSLSIPTANDDALRIASLIRDHGSLIDRIVATLDSHQKLHIAHPCFWIDPQTGQHPPPFTIISTKDLEAGVWTPRGDIKFGSGRSPPRMLGEASDEVPFDVVRYCIEYTHRLEAKGRFQLCIWPEHCLIGSTGHGVVDVIFDAMNEWSRTTGGTVEWVLKGQTLWTEMYSALSAEVSLEEGMAFDHLLMESLKTDTDRLLVAGQALSHCVNYTVRDIVEHWPKGQMTKIILLRDCMSSVPGFDGAGELFLADMVKAGVEVKTSVDPIFL